ncbi:MAG: dipicolinate synthase subunit B [Clostridia bacterium]|nr:dipicolinate synthase subunit B [Clostridia bacterium]
MCGSFCTLMQSFEILEKMSKSGLDFLPVMSEKTYSTDTRFGKAVEYVSKLENICGKTVIHTVQDAEPIGPKLHPDAMIIAPCTGNTLAKLANGITDSSVTMAAKAHLRNNNPLVIALATNDALSANFVNIGKLLARKNIYFVPLIQDDPENKPSSLIANFSLIPQTLEMAMNGKQITPLFYGNYT